MSNSATIIKYLLTLHQCNLHASQQMLCFSLSCKVLDQAVNTDFCIEPHVNQREVVAIMFKHCAVEVKARSF